MDNAGDAGNDQQHEQTQGIEVQAELNLKIAERQPSDDAFSCRLPMGRSVSSRQLPRTWCWMFSVTLPHELAKRHTKRRRNR